MKSVMFYSTQNQKVTCFVLYLKLINTKWKTLEEWENNSGTQKFYTCMHFPHDKIHTSFWDSVQNMIIWI